MFVPKQVYIRLNSMQVSIVFHVFHNLADVKRIVVCLFVFLFFSYVYIIY